MERGGASTPEGSREPSIPTRPFTSAVTLDRRSTSTTAQSDAKLLLVDFRSGEAVRQHPDVEPLLSEGWRIKSAVPRLVEAKGTKLLVVLTPPALRRSDLNMA